MEIDAGPRIRRIRKRLGWTLRRTAERAGCTESLLSKIENGRVIPPVATLARIAAALGSSIGALLGEGGEETTVFTPAAGLEGDGLVEASGRYRFHAFASTRADKLMQPLLFEARSGQPVPPMLKHAGEEFVYVLEGRMRYRVGPRQYEMGPGDSLYFDAVQPHGLEALTPRVRFLAVFVEPQQAATSQPAESEKKVVRRLRRAAAGTRHAADGAVREKRRRG